MSESSSVVSIDWEGVALAITALGSLVAAIGVVIVGVMNNRQSAKIDVQSGRFDAVQKDVVKIEKATNSMKDALVTATRDAALLQGASDQRDKQVLIDSGKAIAVAEAAVKPDGE